MIAAVIFDLYGTLLRLSQDSQPFINIVHGQPTLDARNAIQIALTSDCPTLDDFVTKIGIPKPSNLSELEAEMKYDIDHVEPFTDVMTTLGILREHGVKTAVVSNLATPYKRPYFEHKISDVVNTTVFSCDCGLIKPDPAIYELALSQLGVSAHESIMVGDSLKSDVNGPAALGITGIHLVRSKAPISNTSTIGSLEAILQRCNINNPFTDFEPIR